ncbi:MAG: PAS domain-containing protein, partial [Caulobacteraceae bacterium]|nr:PAS domain-containing protein [Caulobacter sp.]
MPGPRAVPPFLALPGSATAARIAARDWSATSLGPIEGWPISLRTTLATLLACPAPMFLAWGPELLSFYNDSYEPILGYRAANAMGKPFRELWASVWDDIAPLVEAALAGGAPQVTDMKLDLSRSGAPEESYWSFSYSPAFDDAGAVAGMLCVTGETTARVMAERERRAFDERLHRLNEELEQRVADRTAELMEAESALRQAQKMEAVGQLTGGLAHDFNNLLAGISGALELTTTRLAQGRVADVDRYLVSAQAATKRAAALTHRLLAFSRRQTLAPKPTDINGLVSGLTELIQRTVGPAIAVETVEASGLWTALVDASQLENALLNLCINARDAMPEGGRITIETANKWLDRHAAARQDVPEGQYLSLCVSDTGTGMSAAVIAKAFDPFFTTKPLGQGTGLGLSMIYGFAKQSGGQVRIYWEVGQGTMVCLYLPRHLGEAEGDTILPDLAHAPRAEQGETVLVVDDEPTVRMLVTEVLEDLGYAAIEAADGASGLKV